MNKVQKQLADDLAEVPLFSQCTRRDLRAIARHVETVQYQHGEQVVVEGEVSGGFFLVLDGELEVVRLESVVAVLGAGDHFGELALLDPALRSATVVATGDVTLGTLNTRMFRVLLRDMPEIAFAMFGCLAAMLREARRSS